ncbi:MAG: hypothetical protein K9I94_05240 [Bacteroidales bacterium]|nr:hypothetical protein [Bacteroidales bacterium]
MELKAKYRDLVRKAKLMMVKGDISNYIKHLIELQKIESRMHLQAIPVRSDNSPLQ